LTLKITRRKFGLDARPLQYRAGLVVCNELLVVLVNDCHHAINKEQLAQPLVVSKVGNIPQSHPVQM